MELQKEKSLLNNIHPMVRVLLSEKLFVSFMHRLFMSLRFRMNEKSYYYRKVEQLAFWNKHSTKQIWKCRTAFQWKWQHLWWLLNSMNVWIPLHKTKLLVSTTADMHTHISSLYPCSDFIWCCTMNIVCTNKAKIDLFKKHIIHKGAVSSVLSKFAQLYRAGRCL